MVTKKDIVKLIEKCFENGGKVIIFGNGGSMAEASHFATEFIGIGLPAIALSDPATITALANDFAYDIVFDTWLGAIYKENDLVIGISSSGKSINVNLGLMNRNAIDFPRKGKTTSEVQENQLKLIHEIYEYFKNKKAHLENRGV